MKEVLKRLFLLAFSWRTVWAATDVKLNIGRDGTASVSGTVSENYKGCTMDGPCYLKLTGSVEVKLVYDPGETASDPPNRSQVAALIAIKPGALVSAYGSHKQTGKSHSIDVYSNRNYFIHLSTAP